MNNRCVCALSFAVALGAGLAQAQDVGRANAPEPIKAVTKDANWWTRLSGNTKDTFLDGYLAAMGRVSSRLFTECSDKMKKVTTKITSDGRAIATVPAANADVPQIWNLCELGGSFYFAFDRRDLRKGVDEFYKDTQHSQVPIDDALQYVRDVLQSKRPKGGGIGSAARPCLRSATAATNC